MSALEIRGLSKSFGGLQVTRDVDLVVEPGERRLIIGPNGAGKTTLFNLISGELRPSRGEIKLFGQELTRLPPKSRAHLGLARTYQIITLFPHDTLLRNVILSLLALSDKRWNPIIRLDKQSELAERALESLRHVGLDHLAHRVLAQTSYGERRRVEIAMALAQKPKVMLLDEPFAGLSADERRDIHQLLLSIPSDIAVVMIEHDMEVALELARRVTLMHFGKVVVEGNRSEVVSHPVTREIYFDA